VFFEFKTKSDNVQNLLAIAPCENVVVSWSLNPDRMISENEFRTAALRERISAAADCAKHGYSVGFHFDPIIYYNGWEEGYKEVVELLFDSVSNESIAWISIGTLRMNRGLKRVIENRFPENKILDGELLLGTGGKLRYEEGVRLDIYKKMISWIKKRNDSIFVYLCMEDKSVWRMSGLLRGIS